MCIICVHQIYTDSISEMCFNSIQFQTYQFNVTLMRFNMFPSLKYCVSENVELDIFLLCGTGTGQVKKL